MGKQLHRSTSTYYLIIDVLIKYYSFDDNIDEFGKTVKFSIFIIPITLVLDEQLVVS